MGFASSRLTGALGVMAALWWLSVECARWGLLVIGGPCTLGDELGLCCMATLSLVLLVALVHGGVGSCLGLLCCSVGYVLLVGLCSGGNLFTLGANVL